MRQHSLTDRQPREPSADQLIDVGPSRVGTDGDTAAHGHGPIALSTDCIGWARTAHHLTAVADDGDVQLRSEAGAPMTRYFIRRRGADRLELTHADDGEDDHPLLFVAEVDVLERYVVGLPTTSERTLI